MACEKKQTAGYIAEKTLKVYNSLAETKMHLKSIARHGKENLFLATFF